MKRQFRKRYHKYPVSKCKHNLKEKLIRPLRENTDLKTHNLHLKLSFIKAKSRITGHSLPYASSVSQYSCLTWSQIKSGEDSLISHWTGKIKMTMRKIKQKMNTSRAQILQYHLQ